MIDLASLNKNIEKKMQCTILLVKCLKKLGVVKKYEKRLLMKELVIRKRMS